MDQLMLMFVLLFAAILAEPLVRRLGRASAVLMTLFDCVLALIPATWLALGVVLCPAESAGFNRRAGRGV